MELFIKRFIDLLDEMVPVSMVHTLIEQPLGAVTHDSYVKIHARLDLIDENSPYVEIEIYLYDFNNLEALYAYTYPKESILVSEKEFINKLTSNENLTAEKVLPVNDEENFFYEVFYSEEIEIPNNNGAIDELVHQIVPKVKEWLTIGGYRVEE